MRETQANEFFERLTEGTDYTKTIELEHSSGAKLDGFELNPVNKQELASVIERLPDELFDAIDEAEDPDEAEEILEEEGTDVSMNALSEDTVDAFEDIVRKSLSHPEFTSVQINDVVEALDFPILFELGGQVIDISFSSQGAIKDFHEPE